MNRPDRISTATTKKFIIDVDGDQVKVNEAKVTQPDTNFINGFVHIIDTALVSPDDIIQRSINKKGFSILINIYHFTIGLWLANNSLNIKKALQTPVLYALVAALLFKGTNTEVPSVLEDVCKMLGGIVIPLMLIAFGSSLVGIKIGENLKAIRMGIARVIIGFLVVYIAYIFGDFEHIIIATLLIQYSMPVATTSYLFAFKFNGPDKEIAVMTASSTVTILFLLPVIIYLVK